MQFKPAQCPSCGGSLQLPDNRSTVKCMYCGMGIVVQEAIQAAAVATVTNLLRLAQTAAASSNHQEAYDYFTRVLEIDGNNCHAWAGKAEAAGRMSGQHAFRMPEMLSYFGNAIGVASGKQRARVEDNAAQVICQIVSEDFHKMRAALSPAFWETASWIFYLNRVRELIKVLEDANKLIPKNSAILRTIIWLCDGNSGRVSFRDARGKETRREFDSRWKASIQEKKWKYAEELYELNPSLRPQPASIRSTSGFTISSRVVLVGLAGFLLLGGLIIFILVIIELAKNESRTRTANETAPSLPAKQPPPANNASLSPANTETASNFATSIVCSLPGQTFPNTPFARLGGGSWRKWNDSGGELDYACERGTDLIKLKNDGNVDITAEYSVLGNVQSAHYISAEYSAFQYTGQTTAEKTFRQQYADFCDRLASKLYGKTLSKGFRNRLLDESTYSVAGTANQYTEKIGTGYISVSSNKNKAMVMLDVHFFPSEADYKTYKDS